MKTSSSGRALIEQREGRRLTAYRDSRGIWTIGVGHTGRMSPPRVVPSQTITEAQCDALLATDLAPVEAVINTAVTVPLSQNEFDALASLGFNIGVPALRTSTVIRKLNLGDVEGAAAAFMMWAHPAILEGRRAAERAQFLDIAASTGVSQARAQTLAARSAAARHQAKITQAAGGAIALGGAMASTVAAPTHHAVALGVLALVLVSAAIDGLVAWWHHAHAATLAVHAAQQAAAHP